MKAKPAHAGHSTHLRASGTHGKKRHAKSHTRRLPASRIYNIPDEQMSEPPVVPKDERRYWH